MTETNESKLLPCPFCGGEGKVQLYSAKFDTYWVFCKQCGMDSKMAETKSDAIAVWNYRAAGEQPKWTKETPTEEGFYWVLQEGYKRELSNSGYPPLVELLFRPRNGGIEEYWIVRLLAGGFFSSCGAMYSIWDTDPKLEWVLANYDIKGWQKIETPALPEEGNNNG